MKVLSLQCDHQHSFEGWFGSEDDFQSQLARGLVECPMCASKSIVKMPSAPRLNFGGHREPIESLPAASEPVPPSVTASGSGSDAASVRRPFQRLRYRARLAPPTSSNLRFLKRCGMWWPTPKMWATGSPTKPEPCTMVILSRAVFVAKQHSAKPLS